ncbi:hypothetical protein ACIHAA_15720 [Streptomyces sp. NPDC052040]|uniref:hypothetical protein n=1 Tax=unclassified Streptomyces TaxID=2593676 RepID=UPI0037D013D9
MPIRTLALALALSTTVCAGAVACGRGSAARQVAAYITVPSPSPSTPVERLQLARSRFTLDAGLAAGAVQEWIEKPWKAGAFAKDARGRSAALLQAAVAGTFAIHRLKGARHNAQGDPVLARALAPLSAGLDSLGGLPARLRKGDEKAVGAAVGTFTTVIRQLKDAGKSSGVPVRDQVPSGPQLARG